VSDSTVFVILVSWSSATHDNVITCTPITTSTDSDDNDVADNSDDEQETNNNGDSEDNDENTGDGPSMIPFP